MSEGTYIKEREYKPLRILLVTFGCQMETDRDDSGSQDAEYVWS